MSRSDLGAALVLAAALAATPGAVGTAIAGPGFAGAGTDGTATLSGIRFMDRNGDGVRQAEEPGADASPVYLEKPPGERVDEAEISDNGRYVMKGIPPGDYVIVFPLSQYIETTPRKVPVHLTADQWKVVDNGVRGGEASGVAWKDLNGDGQRQDGEPPLPNVRVTLSAAGYAGDTGQDGT